MGEGTAISWADNTQNFWVGCTKVSTGPQGACEHCYAESWAKRGGHPELWSGTRRRTKTWGDPIKWNRAAELTGRRPRVFCSSLSDFFDNEIDPQWRADAWAVIGATKNLRWMLLTKRIGNAPKMLPPDWPRGFEHVGLMATLATQEEWDRDYRKLEAVPAAWHGVSAEPLLGSIDIGDARPDWIITGGESGAGYRLTNPDWIRSLRDQCARNGVAFHFKQWGGIRPKVNGCMLDGHEHKDFPRALAA